MGKRPETEIHTSFCINCGHKGIPICRRISKQHKSFHRKLMYCPNCKHTVNHIECKNEKEAQEFLIHFNKGDFKEEAMNEILYEQTHPRLQDILL